jgi:hypothetical protein
MKCHPPRKRAISFAGSKTCGGATNICFSGCAEVLRGIAMSGQTSAAHRAGCVKLSRNVIQVSDYDPGALILADSADGLNHRGY